MSADTYASVEGLATAVVKCEELPGSWEGCLHRLKEAVRPMVLELLVAAILVGEQDSLPLPSVES